MKSIGTNLRLFIIACGLLVGLATLASAQGDIRILYSPLVLTLQGDRGARVPFEITVINDAQFTTAYFRTVVTGLRESADGVYRTRDDSDWEFGASAWIEMDQTQFAIPPGGSHQVRGWVNIPRRAPAAGYATVILELIPEPRSADADASTEYYQRFTTALEIVVGNQHRRSAYISEMMVIPTASEPALAATYGPNALLFLAALTNDGDIHVRGHGQLIIRDTLGRRLRTVPLGSGRGVVIPDASVDFGSILGLLTPGTYEMEARINYGGHRPAVARTTFEISDEMAGISGQVVGRAMRVDATPSMVELSLPRHGYRGATVTVVNYDNVDVLFKVYAQELVHDVDGTPVSVDADVELPYSAKSWVQIRPDEFVLRPGQRRNVVLGFQVPEGPIGGRYARIRIEAQPAEGGENEQAHIVTDLDVSAFLTMGDGYAPNIELVEALWQQIPGGASLMVGTTVGNAGNIHSPVSARFTLLRYIPPTEELIGDVILQRDARWETVEQVVPEVTPTPILPGEIRFMQGVLATPLEPLTQYQVVYEVPREGEQPILFRLDLWTDEAGLIQEGTIPAALQAENHTGQ